MATRRYSVAFAVRTVGLLELTQVQLDWVRRMAANGWSPWTAQNEPAVQIALVGATRLG